MEVSFFVLPVLARTSQYPAVAVYLFLRTVSFG